MSYIKLSESVATQVVPECILGLVNAALILLIFYKSDNVCVKSLHAFVSKLD